MFAKLNKRYLVKSQNNLFRKLIDRKTWNEVELSKDIFVILIKCDKNQSLNIEEIDIISPFIDDGIIEISQTFREASHDLITEGESKLARRIDMVFLCVTGRCNFKCKHCFFEPNSQLVDLNLEQWKKIVDKLYKAGVYKVCLTGGEALLRNDLSALCNYLSNRGFVYRINTNGFLLSSEKIKELVSAGLTRFQISLDGATSDVHDDFRGMRSFDKIIGNIRELTTLRDENKIDFLSISTMLTKSIIDSLDDLFDIILSDLRPDSWYLERPLPCGSYKNYYDDYSVEMGHAEEKLIELIEKARKVGPTRPGRIFFDKYYDWINYQVYKRNELFFSPYTIADCACGDHFNHLYLLPNGDASICMHTDVFNYIPGNLLGESLDEIWDKLENIKSKDFSLSKMICKDCELLHTCGGGCRVAASLISGDIMGCDVECKEYIQRGIKRNLYDK